MIIKAPNPVLLSNELCTITFLAGSIEMGQAENWQEEVTEALLERWKSPDYEDIILNPRRDDWDSSWTQSIYNDQFKKQVDWELSGLEKSARIIFYFAKGTKSPISLMELGLVSTLKNKSVIVYCDPDFWRRGNIEIMCERYGNIFFTDKEKFLSYLRKS